MLLYRWVRVCRLARLQLLPAMGFMAVLAACSGEAPPASEAAARPVRVYQVVPVASETERRFIGRVAEGNLVDLGFEIEGTLLSLPLGEGSAVAAGATLAQLDPRNSELALARARAEHDGAQKALVRLEALLAQGMASQAQYDDAHTRAELSRVQLDTAQKRLQDATLQAPFDGQIVRHWVEPYTPITRLQPVLQLRSTHSVEIEIDVPEHYVARWDLTSPPAAWVVFDHQPGVQHALQWREYAAHAHPETQTFAMTLALTELPDSTLLPGMTATVLVADSSEQRDPVFPIPIGALQADAQGQPYVWVVQGQPTQVMRRAVEVTVADSGWANVYAGLAAGEQVIAAGGAWLHEGMPVRILAGD